MLACKFQSSVLNVGDQQNYLFCYNQAQSKWFGSLVNSHVCSQCPLKEVKECIRMDERTYEKRDERTINVIYSTACSQCQDYNQTANNCRRITNSKTIHEMIEDSDRHCPRHLW
ncbi:hypothetical protein M0R72_15410 [Candidatus Pacearchaeota archaeon]|nr:hypothetical protein [Candidatus Pacearchaeota archaeon]